MVLIPRVVVIFAAGALVLGACGGDGDSSGSGSGQVEVVASFYPLAEVARQVGGDRVDVVDLTPSGAEPHDLELTTGQVDDLEDADLVVVLGRDFQPAVEDVADRRDGATVAVLDTLNVGEGRVAEEHEGEDAAEEDAEHAEDEKHGDEDVVDPHVWLDPTLMAQIVDAVEGELAEVDPDGASTFATNADTYVATLDGLDQEFETGLASCERREIVTAHEAFGWLAKRYDLEQNAIAGIEPDQEPSADRLAELADLARDEGITTIFTEELVSPDVAETLAREAGGLETEVLNPLEGLSDEEIDNGDDYVSVMRTNLSKLREALGCS
jgi:zinc transport system substrate-binding protein